ncbi:hypothetical protein [Hyphomonas sp.]|uniref:hypothetical protein n=1 Tax=Hyphomonas sp. TaxID=87 RepID=UPI0025BCE588|nr:hypothetical protein [Hyphomonas sp.]
MISAASLLIAGLSFFAFQYLSSDQPILRGLSALGLILLCAVVVQCVAVTYLVSNIYNEGARPGDKRFTTIKKNLNRSSLSMIAGMLVFAGLALFALGQPNAPADNRGSMPMPEKLLYDCDIVYGEETTKMTCIRTHQEAAPEPTNPAKTTPSPARPSQQGG